MLCERELDGEEGGVTQSLSKLACGVVVAVAAAAVVVCCGDHRREAVARLRFARKARSTDVSEVC